MKKDDEFDASSVYAQLDKSSVLQEARVFNETPIKAGKCCLTLTKCLYLLYQGEHLSTTEATDLFFSVTKLFQSRDVQLRRLVYLIIKELSKIANDVIMATSSLTKDMNDRVAAEIGYRANAVRALCTITDASMVQAIERFIKQAIVDKDPSVSSSALVSAIHLHSNGSKDVVKRWVNEVQEALSRPTGLVQYHALGLIYLIKQHDRMSVSKIIQNLTKGNLLRYPLSFCMIIRYASRILDEDGGLEGPSRGLYEILESSLRHRHEMVNLEAARAICGLKGITNKEIFPAVSVLQLFLNSPKSTLRFAAIRTLSKLAISHPNAVIPCNVDMENLISDSNRNIATFAITTLLKTGNESSVDRLMKQITGLMSELSDDFKVIVVDAIRSLCLKFPAKHGMMLQFLASGFNENGYEFKKALVEAIFEIFESIPEAKEAALGHLCEYIDDCEFVRLAVRILFVLGEEGPKMKNPTKYIRFIYNRTILEVAPIRAAAVSALAKFAVALGDEARADIKTLLTRCLDDPDDEVRDRAVMYLQLINRLSLQEANRYVRDDSMFSMDALEEQLVGYCQNTQDFSTAFDIKQVPVVSRGEESLKVKTKNATAQFAQAAGIIPDSNPPSAGPPGSQQKENVLATVDKAIMQIPEFSSFGPVFRSSMPVDLTDHDVSEYVVTCVKHVFTEHIVFQFICRNTLNDVVLEKVGIELETDDMDLLQNLQYQLTLPIPQLRHDTHESSFVVFKRLNTTEIPLGAFKAVMKFISKDCDPQSGEVDEQGFSDSYALEEVEIFVGDFIVPSYSSSFSKVWEEIGDVNEAVETFQLDAMENIPAAVKAILGILGMSPLEASDRMPANKPASQISSHTLLLGGAFLGGARCACRIRMACPGAGVTMEMSVRSDSAEVSQLISQSVG